MNEEQREKLSQVLLEESLTCADRNDLDDAVDLMKQSVNIKYHQTIKRILDGDKKLLRKTIKLQFKGDKAEMIISRCIMNILADNKEFISKNNIFVEWID
tara:strand:- start:889 stop:1188 length:300 start_codon:yes stop_codon:yes gene_type:complete